MFRIDVKQRVNQRLHCLIIGYCIVRGIEKRDIFLDVSDRGSLVQRLGLLLRQTGTQCLAWWIPGSGEFVQRLTEGHGLSERMEPALAAPVLARQVAEAWG